MELDNRTGAPEFVLIDVVEQDKVANERVPAKNRDLADKGIIAREFVLIDVAGQTYALDIMAVREIRGWTSATVLPGAPAYVRGMVNLRGLVLPIVDLGLRLGFPAAEPDGRHAVLVVQLNGRVLGLLVQGVSEILSVDGSAIQPAPDMGREGSNFIVGVLPKEDRMIGVVDLSRALDILADRTQAA